MGNSQDGQDLTDLSEMMITLNHSSYTYTGQVIKPSVTVLNEAGEKLEEDTDYTVTYDSGCKDVGTYYITITGKTDYTGTVTASFKILPKKGTISSLKSAARKKMTVRWKKVSGSVTKYQVRYRVKGTSKWTTKTYSASTKSKTIAGLKSGKTYQVQVRAYKTVGGTKYCGSWSSTKTVKVK